MSAKRQQQPVKIKRRIERRQDKTKFKDTSPVLSGSNLQTWQNLPADSELKHIYEASGLQPAESR